MSLLEIFVTYLAVGSAFAMRGYFLNRRRPFWAKIRIVLTQFFLWLPIWLFRLSRGAGSSRRRRSAASSLDPKIKAHIEHLISLFPGILLRNQVREALERYAALHTALENESGHASGEFELFSISGNGNGTTGTPCLYRKNLTKLKGHKTRTAEDLVRVFRRNAANSLDPQLADFFYFFSDRDSIAKLETLDSETNIDESARIRVAA